jgi:nicotinamide phosphoribosyltransferase
MNPLLLVDSYKIHHKPMYPENMTKLYSNFTPRKSRIEGVNEVVVFGMQHFIKEYLIEMFEKEFFMLRRRAGYQGMNKIRARHISKREADSMLAKELKELRDEVINQYKRHCPVDVKHIEDLWDLGYLPIEIKALDEGTLCPIRVPMMTITNTHPDFAWLVNYLETLISCMLWQPVTSATIAYEYKKILDKYALETTGTTEGVQWQGHDFSMRGMSSVESAIISGMAHLISFTDTDTIPAIYALEDSYAANGLIGASVPATEHSVMCMGTKESELETFRRLMNLYPTGILSIVSDTWNLWDVLTKFLPELKEEILARDGKLVIRPDSGDPVDIICGDPRAIGDAHRYGTNYESISKGVVELLWDVFGGTINEQGYKVLDSHIGAIYGDSITRERAIAICERLKAKGFASTNVVFGIGSYTYQYNTRDTFGFAMKATYGEVNGEGREIFKDPITDDGTKRSAKGLLQVTKTEKEGIKLFDQQEWSDEKEGLLTTVFKDGKLVKETSLKEIRNRLNH